MMNNTFQTEQLLSYGGADEFMSPNSSQIIADKNSLFGYEKFEDFFEENYQFDLDISPQTLSSGDEFQGTVWMDIQKSDQIPSSSFNILNKYGSRSRRLNGQTMNFPTTYEQECTISCGLSIEKVIKLAAEKFIQTASQTANDFSVLSHPYPTSVISQESQEVQLIQNLLSAAEKVGDKLYDRAKKLLLECDKISSPRGSPVERLVFYFTEALYEKIDRETGKITPKGLGKKIDDPLEALKSQPEQTLIAFHKAYPLSQITKFSGIQAVVDNLSEARKVHFIDLEIRQGVQCIILMQALVDRCENPVEHLKITALGTKSKERIEETGRQLMNFANSLDLKLSFNVVMVEDILDLDKNLFELDDEEVIVVYASYTLTNMIGKPKHLDHVMRVIKSISPLVMVVIEVDGNCNSPVFVERFVEALFFYGAWFESMADCMKNDEDQRFLGEKKCFGSSIRNIIATEGDERKIRPVNISVWRAFLTRLGLEEMELSMSSCYQAQLVLNNFSCGDYCTLDFDGKSLIVGWKGMPLSSVSVWKF